MNALGRILGFIDGNIDLGAITGIFGRVAALVARVPVLLTKARVLANEFTHDPRLKAFFDEVQDLIGDIPGLLKLDNGETITPEDIAAYRAAKWPETNDIEVHKIPPKQPPVDRFAYMEVLPSDPSDSLMENGDFVYDDDGNGTRFMVASGRPGSGAKPSSIWPEPGGWKLKRVVKK